MFLGYNINKIKFKDRVIIKFIRTFHISMLFYYFPIAILSITGALNNFYTLNKFNLYSILSIIGARLFTPKGCPLTYWEYRFVKKKYKFKLKLEGYYRYFFKSRFNISFPVRFFDVMTFLTALTLVISYFIY